MSDLNLPNVFSEYWTPVAIVQLWLEQGKLYRELTERISEDNYFNNPEYEEVLANLHLINDALTRSRE